MASALPKPTSPRVPPPVHHSRRRDGPSPASSSRPQEPVPPAVLEPTLTSIPVPSTTDGSQRSAAQIVVEDDIGGVIVTEEEEMSEAQLRQVYDEEEVDRFLRLFSDVSITIPSKVILIKECPVRP